MERDRRGLRLSAGGAILTLCALVAAIAAASSSHWASFTGAMTGYFGPWRVCQSGQYGIILCVGQSSRLQKTWASLVAGVGSAACAALLAVAMFLCPLLVMMHITSTKVLVKFRHATLAKMVCTAASVLCGLVSVLLFVLEVFIFRAGHQSGLYVTLSWAFFIQVLAVALGVVVGVGAGIEFGWSRKLGGDPTVYGRDPEGTAATTISNPNFKDTGNGHAHHGKTSSSGTGSRGRGSQRGGRMHRNSNGVAMTHFSGQPYMITANGSNGHIGGRPNGIVAFDPNKAPLRSSLRKPRPPSDDGPDSSMGIQNMAFAQSSPVLKKKVRIHTQSTSV